MAMEEESKLFLETRFPGVEYDGFQEFSNDLSDGIVLEQSPVHSTYYPVHYIEPMTENMKLLDVDFGASTNPASVYLHEAIEGEKPTLIVPFSISDVFGSDTGHNAFLILNPGIPLRSEGEFQPRDVAALAVGMETFAERLISGIVYRDVKIYLYDQEYLSEGEATFLIGMDLSKDRLGDEFFLEPESLRSLQSRYGPSIEGEMLDIPSVQWYLIVLPIDGMHRPNIAPTIVAGVSILVACVSIAYWIWWNSKKNRKMFLMEQKAKADKTAHKLQGARDHARAEQELNDYIAHEIRNPLSAAICACSFVKTSVNEAVPMRHKESIDSVREDVGIIDSSLTFINDLLRSMLDMHKAESMRMDVNLAPADLKRDVLEPVAAMLYKRDSNFTVEIDCPDNLVLSTDKLRLKQIVLNLGRNSTKFVERGYIRLVAVVVQRRIQIYIEDSGPGIPKEKRKNLFKKFQDSLDVLEQGTGMGLCLCKNLAELLGGVLWLDESFDSGFFGSPGTRFVIETNCLPMSMEECHERLLTAETLDQSSSHGLEQSLRENGKDVSSSRVVESEEKVELPAQFSVLFVDDDMILRKLFSRSLKKVVDSWDVSEAANGEAAIQMLETQSFDLIFLDQYMSSAEKTLLGTETVRALRSQGVTCRICGLSANDMEQAFLAAGADFFVQKPLPCNPTELHGVLSRIVSSRPRNGSHSNGKGTH